MGGRGRQGDATAVGLDDPAGDRQAKAEPAFIAGPRLVDAIEAVEDVLGVFRGNAGARITHFDEARRPVASDGLT